MRQPLNDLLPVAEAEDAREHEISGAGKEIVCGQQPAEIAEIGAGTRGVGGQNRKCAGSKIDDGSAGFNPAILMQAGEMVAGEFGGNSAAKPGSDAVAQALHGATPVMPVATIAMLMMVALLCEAAMAGILPWPLPRWPRITFCG